MQGRRLGVIMKIMVLSEVLENRRAINSKWKMVATAWTVENYHAVIEMSGCFSSGPIASHQSKS